MGKSLDVPPICLDPGDRDVEDRALGEVPRRMEADRKPQAARHHVGRAEQHAGLDRNCQ